MYDYKEHLRRLAIHDEAFVTLLLGEENTQVASALDTKTKGLVRVAATISVDAAPSTFQYAVTLALAAGASSDEIVATLEAVAPMTGAARAVLCAPKLALALGYDVEAELERLAP